MNWLRGCKNVTAEEMEKWLRDMDANHPDRAKVVAMIEQRRSQDGKQRAKR